MRNIRYSAQTNENSAQRRVLNDQICEMSKPLARRKPNADQRPHAHSSVCVNFQVSSPHGYCHFVLQRFATKLAYCPIEPKRASSLNDEF